MKKNYFEFTIKPIPFATLIYFAGWYDFKRGIFGNHVTVGFFFMTVSVWIFLSYLIGYRIKNKNIKQNEKKVKLAGFLTVAIPLYTLIYWIINILKIK